MQHPRNVFFCHLLLYPVYYIQQLGSLFTANLKKKTLNAPRLALITNQSYCCSFCSVFFGNLSRSLIASIITRCKLAILKKPTIHSPELAVPVETFDKRGLKEPPPPLLFLDYLPPSSPGYLSLEIGLPQRSQKCKEKKGRITIRQPWKLYSMNESEIRVPNPTS